MFGSGPESFAVWTYTLSNTNGDHRVELNPQVLAAAIGMDMKAVEEIIQKFCSPDPRSRSKKNEGRKLLHEGGFIYFVVNHEDYLKMQNEESRREYWRTAQQASRERRKQEVNMNHLDAEIPSLETIVQYGGTIACSEDLCKRLWDWHHEKKMWFNTNGQLINWKRTLVKWRENEKVRAATHNNGANQPQPKKEYLEDRI